MADSGNSGPGTREPHVTLTDAMAAGSARPALRDRDAELAARRRALLADYLGDCANES